MTPPGATTPPHQRSSLALLTSAAPWRATAYLFSYLFTGTVLFAVALTAVLTSAVLSLLTLGLPLLIGAAWLLRGSAHVERARTAWLTGRPVGHAYRATSARGLFPRVRARWSDPATRRDFAYLLLLYPPLFALDLAALVLWLTTLGGISVPFWYWAAHSDGQGPQVMVGVHVNDFPTALAVAAVSLLLSLATVQAVVGAARLHAAVARAVLAPHRDPLAEARAVLDAPGPLAPWRPGPATAPPANGGLHGKDGTALT